VHDVRQLRLLTEVYGEDKVALGTDYPFPLGELAPGQGIRAAAFAPAVEQKLLWENAWRWLGRQAP
jgi:aminocarboxymuconate-semialdehyde decarboxylase